MSDHLQLTIDRGIGRILLNRPERMNAFTMEMIDAWVDALEQCRTDSNVKVIVVTGAGKAFCSGGDIIEMTERLEQSPTDRKAELFQRIQRIPLKLEDIDKPVIAAVNGAATGAGFDLALMCDLRYASDTARFAETYLNVGLVPGAGGAFFLPRVVGLAKALDLFLTGEFIDAEEALRIGVVSKVFPAQNLVAEVDQIALRIAERPVGAIRMIKRALYQSQGSSLRTSLDLISSHYAVATSTPEHRAAVEAFKKNAKKPG